MTIVQNEHIKVQENWLDNPDSRSNDSFLNQSNEWKEFLTNSRSSLDNSIFLSAVMRLKMRF